MLQSQLRSCRRQLLVAQEENDRLHQELMRARAGTRDPCLEDRVEDRTEAMKSFACTRSTHREQDGWEWNRIAPCWETKGLDVGAIHGSSVNFPEKKLQTSSDPDPSLVSNRPHDHLSRTRQRTASIKKQSRAASFSNFSSKKIEAVAVEALKVALR